MKQHAVEHQAAACMNLPDAQVVTLSISEIVPADVATRPVERVGAHEPPEHSFRKYASTLD